MANAPLLSIVIPCYNEEAVLPETAKRLEVLLDGLVSAGLCSAQSHVCFVDDGSRDRTWALIQAYSTQSPRLQGLKLSRNRGHQNALIAGLFSVQGDVVISVDADLQDDLNAMTVMLERYRDGYEIVYGIRENRESDSVFKRGSAQAFYRLQEWMGIDVIYNHADYRLMSDRVIRHLREYGEVNLFLRGIIPQLGFRTTSVPYTREARFAGESKYPLGKMLALAFDGITSFSAAPLRYITIAGFFVALMSLVFGVWALAVKLSGDAIPGWASTVLPTYFLGGVQLLCTGIIGEYLAKIYMETKGRPRFFVEATTRQLPLSEDAPFPARYNMQQHEESKRRA